MIDRALTPLLLQRLSEAPAVALLGPRQVGKTTLARSLSGVYFDLEQDADRLRLDLAWPEVVGGKALVVLDEAQAHPPLFERLRGAIDADRGRNGRFLLLGSVAPSLMTHVSESLAGRLALVELTPFTLDEIDLPAADLWLRGGYPGGGAAAPDRFGTWQRDYLSLLAARDLPAWGLPAKPQITDRLLRMIAAVHGQLWNATEIGKSLGLSRHTINSYVDFLLGAFLIRRLPPWHGNLTKRLTKTPRLYWRDSGLLHALHLVRDMDDLLGRPWVGASWEGFVIEQILSAALQCGLAVQPSFFRTSDGYELDLHLDLGGETWAVEVKLTSQPTSGDLARLVRTADLVEASRAFLVSQTTEPLAQGRVWSCRVEHVVAEVVSRGRTARGR